MPAIYLERPYSGSTHNTDSPVALMVTFNTSGLQAGYDAYAIQFYVNGVPVKSAAVNESWVASTTYTFTQKGTYTIQGRLINKENGNYLGYQTGTVTINVVVPRPADWSWSSTVSPGAEMLYNLVGDVTYAYPLTASEWNSFVNRVFAFLKYKDIVTSGQASNYYVTKGTRMYASEVDIMREYIALMNPSKPLPRAISSYDQISASYINGLKDSLNSIA